MSRELPVESGNAKPVKSLSQEEPSSLAPVWPPLPKSQ